MNSIYKKYKERLVEISGKNRSLYSKRIGKQYAYDIGKLLKKDVENTNLFLEFFVHVIKVNSICSFVSWEVQLKSVS